MKIYSKVSLLLGAEVFSLYNKVSICLVGDDCVLISCEACIENFTELLNTELPFEKAGDDLYQVEVLFSSIVKLN